MFIYPTVHQTVFNGSDSSSSKTNSIQSLWFHDLHEKRFVLNFKSMLLCALIAYTNFNIRFETWISVFLSFIFDGMW